MAAKKKQPSPVPVAYFSHSYRPEDRALNMHVWKMLHERGFQFAVDPPGNDNQPMEVTLLERMMRRSACFIAALPNREEEGASSWSPYQKFEYGLAVRSGKTRLILAENGIDESPLLGDPAADIKREFVIYFERRRELDRTEEILIVDEDLERKLDRFTRLAQANVIPPGPMPTVKLVVTQQNSIRYQNVADLLKASGKEGGFELTVLTDNHRDFELLHLFEQAGVVIADVRPDFTPRDILGLIHGRCFPCIRTCWIDDDESEDLLRAALRLSDGQQSVPASNPDTLSLLKGYQVDDRMQPILFWRENRAQDLADKILAIVTRMRHRERNLQRVGDATDYFMNLGGNRVFISNAGELNDMIDPLSAAMTKAGIAFFQYKSTPINIGLDDWKARLKQEIQDASIFLALIDENYFDKDHLCSFEFGEAIRRWNRRELQLLVFCESLDKHLPKFLEHTQVGLRDSVVDIVSSARRMIESGNTVQLQDHELAELASLIVSELDELESAEDVAKATKELTSLRGADAREIQKLIVKQGVSARGFVDALISRSHSQDLGPAPLGELAMSMSRRVRGTSQIRFLKDLVPKHRLIPNLKNYDCLRNRLDRQEHWLVYTDGKLLYSNDVDRANSAAESTLMGLIPELSNRKQDWSSVVDFAGQELTKIVVDANTHLDDWASKRDHRVCIATKMSDLQIPFEWITCGVGQPPLARRHAVHRFVIDSPRDQNRSSLELALSRGASPPPRVLLFGYGGTTLPNVDTEVRSIRSIFHRRFGGKKSSISNSLMWPTSLITAVASNEATPQRLEQELQNGDYQILHVSCHADFDSTGEPFLQLGPSEQERISAEMLCVWAKRSDLRFVFLNCCQSGASSLKSVFNQRPTLCQAFLEAGVPEVVANLWPVRDREAKRLADKFYQEFLEVFDASAALFKARTDTNLLKNQIWASSLLVRQDPQAV